MLGDSLLVAPIFSSDGTVDYYLPEGHWTNFITNKVIEGGRWIHEKHDYLSLPLMVRPNTIIPVGINEQQPDYDYADGVVFHVFELQDNMTVSRSVVTRKGEVAIVIKASRKGQQIHVQTKGASKSWSILLRGVDSVLSVKGGTTRADALGTLLIPKKGVNRLNIHLPKH
ncbi:MAG: glycoside hydrolase family 31 protein, partial [Candidatus Jordarchaeaceae archaeon]